MIESISDAIQLLVLAVCFALSLVRALSVRNTAWLSVVCFYSCMLLGNAYWFGYLLVFGETPRFSYVADLSWIAGYVFLLMLEIESDQCRPLSAPVPVAWIPVAMCAACGVYYIVSHGSLLLNIADNGLMAAIGYFAVRGIVARPDSQSAVRPEAKPIEGPAANGFAYNRPFHVAVLAFVVVEQALWMSSCFLEPGPIESLGPYIVIGFVLTLSYALILACAWKSDAS